MAVDAVYSSDSCGSQSLNFQKSMQGTQGSLSPAVPINRNEIRTALRPEQYVAKIEGHARRSQARHLHSGGNYLDLVRLLRASNYNSGSRSQGQSYAFVVSHIISSNALRSIQTFNVNQIGEYEKLSLEETDLCEILFIRGFSIGRWPALLGARYRLDPEFLRRHIMPSPSIGSFDLPSLPSASRSVITLRVPTIYRRGLALSTAAMLEARENSNEMVRKYQQNLLVNSDVGGAMIRHLAFHDETLLTIDQAISCCAGKRSGGWRVFVWMDSGPGLANFVSRLARTEESLRDLKASDVECLPIHQHRTREPFDGQTPHYPVENDGEFRGTPAVYQSCCLLPFQFAADLDPENMASDVMYTLSDLFAFAAHAESQFLNMLSLQISERTSCRGEETVMALEDLKYTRSLLEDHRRYLQEVAMCIENRGDARWPCATQAPHSTIAHETIQSLRHDYADLICRARNLSLRCTEGANMIAIRAMLEESRKVMDQAERLNRLSLLAFFFLPLSFVTSLFGMNFIEFGHGQLSVWWFPIVLVPTFGTAMLLSFWDGFVELFYRTRSR